MLSTPGDIVVSRSELRHLQAAAAAHMLGNMLGNDRHRCEVQPHFQGEQLQAAAQALLGLTPWQKGSKGWGRKRGAEREGRSDVLYYLESQGVH